MYEVTLINHRALASIIDAYRELEPRGPRTLLLLSPSDDDLAFLRSRFPEARFLIATRGTWDLNQPFPVAGSVDLVIASNVFHYSPDPERWFANVLAMTRYFILQDLVSRRRSTTPDGLCDDGDRTRYSFVSRGVSSEFASAYDLSAQASHIRLFETFDGGRNEHHAPPLAAPLHFCALLASAGPREGRVLRAGEYLRYRVPYLRRVFRRTLRRAFGGS